MNIKENNRKYNKVCLMTNFRTMLPDNIDMINIFNKKLNDLGVTLILLTWDTSDKLDCQYIKIPVSLNKFALTEIKDITLDFFNDDLIDIDMEFNDDLDGLKSDYEKGLRKFHFFVHYLIKELKPIYAFLWASTLPQSVIFKNILSTYFIPTYYWERGLLPETLMFEEVGNGALSIQKTSFNQNYLLDNSNSNDYESIKKYYLENKIVKHEQDIFVDKIGFLKENNFDEKKVLVFFGQWDVAGGINKTNDLQTQMNSPFFEDTKSAFSKLSELISTKENLILIFKPHPFDTNSYSANESQGIYLTKKTNIHSLMKAADIMVFMSTTIQYEAIFYEKPFILLGNSLLNGKNIGYEIKSDFEIEDVLNETLNGKNFEIKLENSKKYIMGISQNYLVATNKKNPIKRKIADFVNYTFNQTFMNRFCEPTHEELSIIIKKIKEKLKLNIQERVESLIKQSEKLISQNHLDQAKDLLIDLLKNVDSNSIDAANNLAAVDIMLGNIIDAEDLIIQILKKYPDNDIALDNMNYINQNFIQGSTNANSS